MSRYHTHPEIATIPVRVGLACCMRDILPSRGSRSDSSPRLILPCIRPTRLGPGASPNRLVLPGITTSGFGKSDHRPGASFRRIEVRAKSKIPFSWQWHNLAQASPVWPQRLSIVPASANVVPNRIRRRAPSWPSAPPVSASGIPH